VTIVLASIAENGKAMIMASDRMLGRADLTYQFEHDSVKIRSVGKHLVGYSGTTTFADDILSHDYDTSKSERDFVEGLSAFYIKYGTTIATRVLLEPLGIDLATFNANPQLYPPFIQERIYERLGTSKLNVEFIICGYDKDEPKMYMVGQFGVYTTAHSIGNTAIGIGATHAASFYMANTFRFDTPVKEAIYFAFQAKRSAEIAAGVGQCTDISVLRPNKAPVFYRDGSLFIQKLNDIYEKHRGKQRELYDGQVLPELDGLDLEVPDGNS
jgi:hypothetical protein